MADIIIAQTHTHTHTFAFTHLAVLRVEQAAEGLREGLHLPLVLQGAHRAVQHHGDLDRGPE
mgnify:CR=1 FL=1